MVMLHPPGLRVLVTVPDDRADLYLRQGWRRADTSPDLPSVPEFKLDEGADVRDEVTTTGEVVPPRRHGPGSSAYRWREYAAAVGVDVPGNATRDDIIAALDKAGVPTE